MGTPALPCFSIFNRASEEMYTCKYKIKFPPFT